MMWVESQTSPIIALLVFAACYALAAVVFTITIAVHRLRFANGLKFTSPGLLSPLGAIAGLLIAFLAIRVWTNLDQASADIAQEASSIRQLVLLADLLPNDIRDVLHAEVKTYISFIEAEDWPAMARGSANLHRVPPGLTDAMASLLTFVPTTTGQRIGKERAVVAIEHALNARRSRILLSETAVAPIQWTVILTLDGLILLIIVLITIDHKMARAAEMFVISSAFAVTITLLMVYDRPFASGGISMEPAALREIAVE